MTRQFAQCPGSARCYNAQLFCRSLAKCGGLDLETWKRNCVTPGTSDGLQLPLAIIVAVFCVIAATFLGLGAKLLYQHCAGGAGRGRGEGEGACRGRGDSLHLRSMAVSPSTPLREEEERGGGGGGGGRRLEAREEVGALPALPPSYSEAVAAGAVFKDDPPKYSDIQK